MKRTLVLATGAMMLLAGCSTYGSSGAYSGSMLGSVLGSAIGGIAGGPRGSDIGTIVGMAGGAVVGSAVDAKIAAQRQADIEQMRHDRQQRQENLEQMKRDREQRRRDNIERQNGQTDDYNVTDNAARGFNDTTPDDGEGSGFDPSNSGDDRIYDFSGSDYTGNYTADAPKTVVPEVAASGLLSSAPDNRPAVEIRNARFVDDNRDNAIGRNELCKVIFEVYNHGKTALHDIVPTVTETTGNKQIFISPSIHVEQIAPGQGIRYTALVKAGRRLKAGQVKIRASVVQDGKTVSKVSEFDITTKK